MKRFMTSEIKEAIATAKKIVSLSGHPIIRDGYYNDTVIGKTYKLDDLEINTYESSMCIYLGDMKVLYYDYSTDEVEYAEGSWPELIDRVYNLVRKEYEKKDEKYKSDYNGLRSVKPEEGVKILNNLKPYYSYYVELYKNKNNKDIQEYIEKELDKYDIKITHECEVSEVTFTPTEYPQFTEHYYYKVCYKDIKVTTFSDNSYSPIEAYINSPRVLDLRAGYWIDVFKRVLDDSKKISSKTEKDEINKRINQILENNEELKNTSYIVASNDNSEEPTNTSEYVPTYEEILEELRNLRQSSSKDDNKESTTDDNNIKGKIKSIFKKLM